MPALFKIFHVSYTMTEYGRLTQLESEGYTRNLLQPSEQAWLGANVRYIYKRVYFMRTNESSNTNTDSA